jgi:hypothetical protein
MNEFQSVIKHKIHTAQYVYYRAFYVIMNSIQQMHLDDIYYIKLKSPTCFGRYWPSSGREVIEYQEQIYNNIQSQSIVGSVNVKMS